MDSKKMTDLTKIIQGMQELIERHKQDHKGACKVCAMVQIELKGIKESLEAVENLIEDKIKWADKIYDGLEINKDISQTDFANTTLLTEARIHALSELKLQIEKWKGEIKRELLNNH